MFIHVDETGNNTDLISFHKGLYVDDGLGPVLAYYDTKSGYVRFVSGVNQDRLDVLNLLRRFNWLYHE
jgi:hypothetical protein